MQCSQNKIVFTNAFNITYTRFKVEMRHTSQWGPFFLVNSPSECFILPFIFILFSVLGGCWYGGNIENGQKNDHKQLQITQVV